MCVDLNPSGCRQLESRVLGNLHARFGGGRQKRTDNSTSLAAYPTG
ncbi:hypothetical protein KSZ_50080 [Dictyobacter formicarum]|uniref:Uncharacterized protein n=1 Tax=Dictyobacter formicarum TaxID=2778368 RepID=A0ABQ3VLA4_9CHLR|nr:hypothetical protein KSZ_50080 [Dictyobacter formicarum]